LTTHFDITPNPHPATDEERARILADPGFGNHFTDHMVHVSWTRDDGWGTPEILPYGPIHLMPSGAVLHYGQEIFEGLKAYRHADGSIWGFRPDANARRMTHSADRLALPELPEELFVDAVAKLVEIDQAWVPTGGESSLYLRPFMYASESFLGVRASHTVEFYVIASPASAYFSHGVQPVSIWVADHFSRAGRGGTGDAKCGGNYASSLLAQEQAYANDCEQVLFLDAATGKNVEELGGMNLFVVTRDGRLVTPALTGSILEGITRSSVLALAQDRGLDVSEETIDFEELLAGITAGEVTEVFACGTAAVINPVRGFRSADGEWLVGDGGSGETTMDLRRRLLDIQYGRAEDAHDWTVRFV
jgi:branched-chain amino acid aminotransferase